MRKELIKSQKNNILNGLILLKPDIIRDKRGLFFESWNELKLLNIIGENIKFVQDNHSSSAKNVLRGLHYQINPYEQGKLVRCSNGEIFDITVDIRKDSLTFGQWAGVILNSKNHNQLWIPAGFAHGFLVLSDNADVNYKTTNHWSKEHECSIRWDDPSISINWPNKSNKYNISDNDKNALYLKDISIEKLF